MSLRNEKKFFRIVSDIGDATVHRLVDEMHSASFDQNMFRRMMHGAKDC